MGAEIRHEGREEMTAPTAIADALAKIDQAIRLLTEAQAKNPRPAIEMAIAALESAKMDLLGQKPS